jgi:hypothetical protein
MVELTNGEIIGIKVDSVVPPSTPHNFYGTQTSAGNFFGLPSNSINFDSRTSFNPSKVNMFPSYNGGSVLLGPVSPPAEIGKTLIPEPFAFKRSGRTMGNGSDSVLNWGALPETIVNILNNDITFQVNKPGFDGFNIWQPGMIPGLKNPPQNASQTIDLPFGKGSGYYQSGDGNTPEMFQVISTSTDMVDVNDYANITMGWADPRHCPGNNPFVLCSVDSAQNIINDYPVVDATLGWYQPQPRFKYSKRFTLDVQTSNNDSLNDNNDWANSSVYYNSQEVRYAYKKSDSTEPVFVNGNYPNPSDTTFRPDEIFVACFWTQDHLYKDQIVGYGPDAQNAGNRVPIIKDYYGTITRCKYIRLTELPLDAVLVRPECDTGWGGEELNVSPQDRLVSANSTAMDLLDRPVDVVSGTSATQNNQVNTGSPVTGGITPENPDANQTGAFDIDNVQTLPAGYQSENNILVEPGDQSSATPPNSEADSGVGIGLEDLSQVEFNLAAGETPFDNQGTNVDQTLSPQNTNIEYPTTLNGSYASSPVLNPDLLTLPGPCDIGPPVEPVRGLIDASCDISQSVVLSFTGANNYYGIANGVKGSKWQEISENKDIPKYEWHNFGKLANKYEGGEKAWIELVADFRDDQITAGGITVVQSLTPFGVLPGQTFNPRDPGQSFLVNQWWRSARVITGLDSTRDGLNYGSENFQGSNYGRASGNTLPGQDRIGLTTQEAKDYNNSDGSGAGPLKKPGDWGTTDTPSEWLTTDQIIGGDTRSATGLEQFANHNSIKGVLGFNAEVDCRQGQYLTVFVHIGHGSGAPFENHSIPRYDFMIRYNHNVNGYGGSDGPPVDVCGDGLPPASATYAGGAHALAYKSQTTSATGSGYKTSTAIRAGTTQKINLDPTGTKDDTSLLPQGVNDSWLFDNIYFPYNISPVRQGEPVADDDPSVGPGENDYYSLCCDPSLSQGTSGVNIYATDFCRRFRAENRCGGRANQSFGGGSVQGAGMMGNFYNWLLK